MRELSFSAHPERHDLVSVCLINELLYARASASRLRLMLPAAEGAVVNLPAPSLFPDLFGDRSSRALYLAEVLKWYLDSGGDLQLAVAWDGVKVDPTLLHLSRELSMYSVRAEVRAYSNLSMFAVVGECSAFEATMRPGRFALNEGIFRFYSGASELQQRAQFFDDYWTQTPTVPWQGGLA